VAPTLHVAAQLGNGKVGRRLIGRTREIAKFLAYLRRRERAMAKIGAHPMTPSGEGKEARRALADANSPIPESTRVLMICVERIRICRCTSWA
jgi:hypothetical protein